MKNTNKKPSKIMTDIYTKQEKVRQEKVRQEKVRQEKDQNKTNREPIKTIFKRVGILALITPFILAQVALLSAYEAHIINVTAKICHYSETRTPGYWKTHPEVYEPYLSVTLGCDDISTVEEATAIFVRCDARNMREKLKCHLLAMKFNIAHYDVGNVYIEACDGEPIGDYINSLVAQADTLLCNGATRQELEAIKNKLDCINNLHKIEQCATPTALSNILSPNVQVEISNEITTNEGTQIIIPESTESQTEKPTPPPSSEETPIEETSPEETPTEETSSEETPTEEVSPEETPTEETLSEDTPTE